MENIIVFIIIVVAGFAFKKIQSYLGKQKLLKSNIDLTQAQTVIIRFYSDYSEISPEQFDEQLRTAYSFLTTPTISKYQDEDIDDVWEIVYTEHMVPDSNVLGELQNYREKTSIDIGGEYDGYSIEYTDAQGQKVVQKIT